MSRGAAGRLAPRGPLHVLLVGTARLCRPLAWDGRAAKRGWKDASRRGAPAGRGAFLTHTTRRGHREATHVGDTFALTLSVDGPPAAGTESEVSPAAPARCRPPGERLPTFTAEAPAHPEDLCAVNQQLSRHFRSPGREKRAQWQGRHGPAALDDGARAENRVSVTPWLQLWPSAHPGRVADALLPVTAWGRRPCRVTVWVPMSVSLRNFSASRGKGF